MKHPFDDFLPTSFHSLREDKRVIRIGILLVAVVSIATAIAFTTTLSDWRLLLKNRGSVAARWDDANTRATTFVQAQKNMEDSIEAATHLDLLVDGVPRSIILWEITQALPEQTVLDDIRLETRVRVGGDNEERTELITLLGIAPNDASISSYIDNLSVSTYLKNISLMYAQQEGNTTRRNFSMQMEVESNTILVLRPEQ